MCFTKKYIYKILSDFQTLLFKFLGSFSHVVFFPNYLVSISFKFVIFNKVENHAAKWNFLKSRITKKKADEKC